MPRFRFEIDIHETVELIVEADDEDEARELASDPEYQEGHADWDRADRGGFQATYVGPVDEDD